MKMFFLTALLASSAIASAAPQIDKLNCILTNGVVIDAVSKEGEPLKAVSTLWGWRKDFDVTVQDQAAGDITPISLKNKDEEYILNLPLKRDITSEQKVHGEVRTLDLVIPKYYALVAFAGCTVTLH